MAVSDKPNNSLTPKRRVWRVLRLVGKGLLMMVALVVIAHTALQATGTLERVAAFVEMAKPWLWMAQLSLIGLLWAKWQRVIHWLAARGRIHPRAVPHALGARHRVLVTLLVIELVVVMGFPFSLMQPAAGP